MDGFYFHLHLEAKIVERVRCAEGVEGGKVRWALKTMTMTKAMIMKIMMMMMMKVRRRRRMQRHRARMRIADAEPAGLWVLVEKWEAISETMVLHMLEDH